MLSLLAQAHLDLDHVHTAVEIAAQASVRARAASQRPDLVEALRVQALVAIRQKRWDDVERALEEGLALARCMPYPYGEARLLHVYGEVHAGKGEPGPARERLEAALAIFRRLGARKDAERVEQDLAALPLTLP
jgi:hypothetical protein